MFRVRQLKKIRQTLTVAPKVLRRGVIPTSRRGGRGFSRGELTEACLNVADAMQLGLSIDVRRSSIHQWNVDVLKDFKAKKPKGTRKMKKEDKLEKH